jgi:SAM-dependent methyltransferase
MGSRWNDEVFTSHMERLVWTASPTVRRYLHRLVSGQPECDWVTYVEWKHLPPRVDRALVLGCGSGWLERALLSRGRFASIVACDFAADTVARARERAADLPIGSIEYRVVDLEHEPLDGPYGAIFVNDVLHHISDLEGIYDRIYGALSPDGKLLFSEYVGPNRFQYSEERMDLINRYFRVLPDPLRVDHVTGRLLWKRERLTTEQVTREDPTEAVRSEEVLPLARDRFEAEAIYPYGGGLLNPLLFGIVPNFREQENPDHVRLLEILCDAEARLSETGAISPDFSIFVGRRNGHGK